MLRQGTRAIHDRLDQIGGSLPLSDRCSYGAFLRAQGAARSAVETGLTRTPPEDLSPPPVLTTLIARDLDELGEGAIPAVPAIDFDTPSHALGAAWVVAGSSMGNRAMLAQRRKAGLRNADTFLSDTAMPDYFGKLLPVLDQPRSAEDETYVLTGARITFELFLEMFEGHVEMVGA